MIGKNQYLHCQGDQKIVHLDVNIDCVSNAEISYFLRAFRILEADTRFSGYTVYFLWSATFPLPSIGPKVICVVFGDEHCRVPSYAGKVAAIFKTYGFFPNFVFRTKPIRLAQIEAIEFLRNFLLWMPSGWRWLIFSRVRRNCHLVALCYGKITNVLPEEFENRPLLISFLGSLKSPQSESKIRRLIGTPKSFCRNSMLKALDKVQTKYGRKLIKLEIKSDFQDSMNNDGSAYFEMLSKTKICVAPRGTAHETFRVIEGVRFGCVVISDRLPAHEFYRDSPIIQLDDWKDLPAIVDQLVSEPGAMEKIHKKTMEYWWSTLCENRLAEKMSAALGLRI